MNHKMLISAMDDTKDSELLDYFIWLRLGLIDTINIKTKKKDPKGVILLHDIVYLEMLYRGML